MTVVAKTINDLEYLYYQDWVKTNGKGKTVSTVICRADLDPKEVLKAKVGTLPKHAIRISKAQNLIKKTQYHFEKIKGVDELAEDGLENWKWLYDVIFKNLSEFEKEEFSKTFFTKYVHGTTAIEGNTFNEDETRKLLATGRTVENKTVNETLEISNYITVRKYFEKYTSGITENLIKNIHVILMVGMTDSYGRQLVIGKYRTSAVRLRDINFIPSSPELIPDNIYYLIQEYNDGIKNNIHPTEMAAYFHQRFEEIHPFSDGNGRVGREILNYMLKRHGYPQIYMGEKQQSTYFSALEKGNQQDYKPLFDFIIQRIGATMQYLYTKTFVYQYMSSEELKNLGKSYDAEAYDEFLKLLKEAHDSKELP